MTAPTRTEAKIDTSNSHYLEQRALELALSRAASEGERAAIERLAALRAELEVKREAHSQLMNARRHARGEFYSDAKVKAINEMGPRREDLDKTVNHYYAKQDGAKGVLKVHGLSHFGAVTVSRRSSLSAAPPDIIDDVRQMLELEDAFADAWAAAIDDPAYNAGLAQRRLDAAKMFRTASMPMWLVSQPECPMQRDMDAATLGRAWSKLESISAEQGLAPLSNYVGIDGQAEEDGAPAAEVLAAVDGLLAAIGASTKKLPAKKATLAALEEVRAILQWAEQHQARVYFEVEF
ncbi:MULTISPECIES: hypothetical protein [unclassified Duganella]|uniref:hypothetical protein n=1 Tax=unclassified Duganella TaxID=2636909 RepID=UPI0006F2D000|nr:MULTISPECIES: hypothetical protein [unclassified Duganella]KQV46001.1 hypothetical protein ASD07_16050 [Duganella sp. Root336D2]KRB81667.1 hypothetical protein ASE26_15095 [Duganella sp. Root198D2]